MRRVLPRFVDPRVMMALSKLLVNPSFAWHHSHVVARVSIVPSIAGAAEFDSRVPLRLRAPSADGGASEQHMDRSIAIYSQPTNER